MKIAIIVNPISGRGTGKKSIPEIRQYMEKEGAEFRIFETEKPWHAAELAEKAAQNGYDVVAAAGGDGTANEVLNGLMRISSGRKQRPAFAVLCVGRGNDFAYGVNAPSALSEACALIANGHREPLDVGFVKGGLFPQGRYFGNGVGIGFDAVVGFEALKLAPLSGFFCYIVAALKTIFLYDKAPMVEIQMDGETLRQPALMVSVMNGRRMGGGFMMAPEALSHDGFLDICIAGDVKKGGILPLIGRFIKGNQSTHPLIITRRVQKITVRAIGGTLPAHSDGETLCTEGSLLEIEIRPDQIDIISVKSHHPGKHATDS